jgi:hypothetical protein
MKIMIMHIMNGYSGEVLRTYLFHEIYNEASGLISGYSEDSGLIS